MKEKRTIVYNLAKCILFCHKNGILHKDLKLENIMVKDNLSVTLVDFGYSEVIPRPKGIGVKFCGTPFYVPPEFIKKDKVHGEYILSNFQVFLLIYGLLELFISEL